MEFLGMTLQCLYCTQVWEKLNTGLTSVLDCFGLGGLGAATQLLELFRDLIETYIL